MTAPIPALFSPSPTLPGREAATPFIAATPRLALPSQAETARALRPVAPSNALADARLSLARERPVGPPPAFAITLLQHLRETAFDPPPPPLEDDPKTAPDTRDGPFQGVKSGDQTPPTLPAETAGAEAAADTAMPAAGQSDGVGVAQMDRRL